MNKGSCKIWILHKTGLGLILLLAMLSASSCRVNKYLKEGEYLVDKVKIKFEKDHKDFNRKEIESGLRYFILQERNASVFGIPKEYIYFRHSKPEDTSRYDRVMRNVFGEEPSIFDTVLTNQTVDRMKSWLRYNKGFYNAEVTYEAKPRKYNTNVEYIAQLGRRYRYNSITFLSADTAILQEVKTLWSRGPIREKQYVDRDRFTQEINRITNELQNMGYADFAAKYFDIKGDSTAGNYGIDLFVEIYPPENRPVHKVYTVGEITVYTDFYSRQDTFGLTSDTLEQVVYKKESQKFLVQPKVLNKILLFREGELVRKTPRLKTFNKLSTLSSYRFAAINPRPSLSDTSAIDYDILLSPYPTKYIADYGFDLLYSTLGRSLDSVSTSIGRNIIGFSFNGQIQNRNFLGGSEKYTLTGEIGGQLELAKPVKLRTYNFGLSNYLEFPIFRDLMGQIVTLNRLGFVRNATYLKLKERAVSTMNVAFSNTDIRDFYRIFIVNGSYGFKLSDRVDRSLNMNNFGVTLNSYELRDSFLNQVKDNPLVLNTFKDNLFTGFLFRNMLYSRTGYFRDRSWQWALYNNLEFSGLEILGANKLVNALTRDTTVWSLGEERFEFAKFGKIELDGRVFKNLFRGTTLAFRLNAGLIKPFADTESSPFVKQFDAGGPNSLRGWGAREIGPGASTQGITSTNILPFQKGDIKLEANAEFRFPLWWLIDGAFFVDVGNIWTLQDDGNEGQFTRNFYKQLAVAGGWSLRMDFTYFLIRFDFGYRFRNPYLITRDDGTRTNWNSGRNILGQGIGNFQVGINHPF